MADQRAEILAGAAVLAAAIGFLAYAGQSTGMTGGSDSYVLTASFRSVDGISPGSDVRLAGVKVGSITSLTLSGYKESVSGKSEKQPVNLIHQGAGTRAVSKALKPTVRERILADAIRL